MFPMFPPYISKLAMAVNEPQKVYKTTSSGEIQGQTWPGLYVKDKN